MKIQIQDIENDGALVRCQNSLVKISPLITKGYKNYRLAWKVGKKGFRRSYSSREKAISEAERIVKALSVADGAVSAVSGEDVMYYRECQKKLGSIPLHVAIEFYIKYHGMSDGAGKTFAAVAKEFLESKERKDLLLSKPYIRSIKYRVKVWSGFFPKDDIRTLTGPRITEALDKCKYDVTTKRNLVATLAGILAFARKKNYMSQSARPVSEIELGVKPAKTPEIYTPEELMKLFIISEKAALPYVALMAFAGTRRAEVESSFWHQIDLEDGSMRIPAEVAKTRNPRGIDIPSNLKVWLTEFEGEGLLVKRRRDVFTPERASEVGLVIKDNALRHSFCSYHLAKHRNAAFTAEIAGNSPKMLRDHYKALVGKAAAEEWFTITPTTVREYAEKNNLAELITW